MKRRKPTASRQKDRFLTLDPPRIARLKRNIAEERRRSRFAGNDSVAVLFALRRALKPVAELPTPSAKGREPVALVPISRARAKDIVLAVDYAMSLGIALRYLRRAAARAVLAGRERSGSEIKARRKAMAQLEAELLHVDLSARHRQSRFNFFEILRVYYALTRGTGRHDFEYRSLESMAANREPITIRCPVQPSEAFKRLSDLFGFASQDAALRYLIDVRKRGREAALAGGVDKELVAAFLADLPFVPGGRL